MRYLFDMSDPTPLMADSGTSICDLAAEFPDANDSPPMLDNEVSTSADFLEGASCFPTNDFDGLPPVLEDQSRSMHCTSPVYGPVMEGPLLPSGSYGPELDVTTYKDVPDVNAIPGVCGLRNLGNTCFMNAGLQCLLCNSKLVKHFLENVPREITELELEENLTSKFYSVLEKVWCGQYSVIWPAKFKYTLGQIFSQFQDYRQHDCQEFLALILDTLHEYLNDAKHVQLQTIESSGAEASLTSAAGTCEPNNISAIPNNKKELSSQEPSLGAIWNKRLGFALAESDSRGDTPSPDYNEPGNVTPMSEESNLSTISCQSVDSISNDGLLSHRMHPIPECVKTQYDSERIFRPIDIPNNSMFLSSAKQGLEENINCSNQYQADEPNNQEQRMFNKADDADFVSNEETNGEELTFQSGNTSEASSLKLTELSGFTGDAALSVSASSSGGDNLDKPHVVIPSIEDLYMKDTKTKNVNVVAMELEEKPTVDSEKFAKHDIPQQFEAFGSITEVAEYVAKPGSSNFKSTNLYSNVTTNNREKFGGECVKVKFKAMQKDDTICSFDNIKRMKVDDTPKNIKQEAKRKVNTAKNLTKEDSVQGSNSQQFLASGDNIQANVLSQDTAPVEEGCHSLKEPLNEQDVIEAEKAWQGYLQKNCSVIVETFQGQFKSTVVCSECHHISVTYEPFMYLSVPLPYAMERQITVIYIPCDNAQPTRYLVTMHKQDNTQKLKRALMEFIGKDNSEVILAESLNHHVSKVLDDHTLLRFVNDSSRTIYALEMLPPPHMEDADSSSPDSKMKVIEDADVACSIQSPVIECQTNSDDVFSTMGTFDASMIDTYDTPHSQSGENPQSQDYLPVWGDYVPSGATPDWSGLAEIGQIASSEEQSTNTNIYHIPAPVRKSSSMETQNSDASASDWLVNANRMDGSDNGDTATFTSSDATLDEGSGEKKQSVEQWKMCAICLEDIPSSDLVTHAACGGTLCNSCFEMSLKHYGATNFSCPVCSTCVNPADEFVPLSTLPSMKLKTRILSVPVVFRNDTEISSHLFGHPRILYLPSNTTGKHIYDTISTIIPIYEEFVVVLTDGQGLHCSRCMFTEHCSGCEVAQSGDIHLLTGDHLAVKFTNLDNLQVENTGTFVDHSSLENLRPNVPLTLNDCLKAFSESEILDEHNPWYCPKCCRNQCARKTMSMWAFPDTLVVYLKRFVYHELSSTKLDNKVVFPIENFDLSEFLSGPDNMELIYDLQAIVCHFGGANAGHYTSYSKHPLRDEWYYYNDEMASQQNPTEEDYSHAYILFYQRQGNQVLFNIPDKVVETEETKVSKKPNSLSAINPDTFGQILQDLADSSAKQEKEREEENELDFYA